jgi:hypothetical protein
MTDTCDCPSIGSIDKQDLIYEKQKKRTEKRLGVKCLHAYCFRTVVSRLVLRHFVTLRYVGRI